MVTLTELPAEILALVASNLEKSDLFSLCLVSRLWHEISEPLLWHTYTFKRWVSNHFSHGAPIPKHSIAHLVRRLISEPDRAEKIKRLELRRWSTLQDQEDHDFEPPDLANEEFIDFFAEAKRLRILGPDASATYYLRLPNKAIHDPYDERYNPDPEDGNCRDDREWINLLHAGFEDPQVTLLVALLPKLEELQIRWVPREFLSWNRLRYVPHGFRHLRKLILPDINNHLPKFTSLLSAPKMQIFDGMNGADSCYPEYRTVPWVFPPAASTITQLYLDHFALNLESVTSLIGFCRGLKTFYYKSGGWGVGTNQFSFQHVIEKLQMHKDTLNHLALNWSEDKLPCTYNPGLRSFEKLSLLDIQMNTLHCPDGMAFYDVLPRSIETLCLEFTYPFVEGTQDAEDDESEVDAWDMVMSPLLNFATAVSEHQFPKLKTLHAVFFGEDDDPDLQEVGRRMMQANTALDISPYDSDYGGFLRRFRRLVSNH